MGGDGGGVGDGEPAWFSEDSEAPEGDEGAEGDGGEGGFPDPAEAGLVDGDTAFEADGGEEVDG